MPFAMNEKLRLVVAGIALLAAVSPRAASAEPLSTSDALNEAFRNNPTLRAAASELDAAQALTKSESARYDPTLRVSLGATRSKTPSLSPSSSAVQVGSSDVVEGNATLQKTLSAGTQLSASVDASASKSSSPYIFSSGQGAAQPVVLVTGPGYLLSAKLGVTQPLLRGFGSEVTLAPYRQAVAQQTATERERSRTANALARDVLLAYWELWYASQAVEVDRAAQQTSMAQRNDATLRARTGSLASADVLTFETQLATVEESLLQSELERTTRQTELARLLGRKLAATDASALEVSEPAPPEPRDLPTELVDVALQSSPEIAANQANVAIAEVQQRTAADAYRPRLDVDAYVQAQGLGNRDIPDAFSQLAGFGVLSAHVGLTLELPLTNTRYQSEARRARANLETARENLGALRNQVMSEVTTLVRKRELARKRILIASGGVSFAEQQLAAKRALFVTGSATALEVTQAQDTVQTANKRAARARADLIEADLVIAYHLDALLKNQVASR